MSLFKTREWWTVDVGDGDAPEDICGGGSLLTAHLNAEDSKGTQIVVGCYTGGLNIYNPQVSTIVFATLYWLSTSQSVVFGRWYQIDIRDAFMSKKYLGDIYIFIPIILNKFSDTFVYLKSEDTFASATLYYLPVSLYLPLTPTFCEDLAVSDDLL